MRVRCVNLNLKGLGSAWFEGRAEAVIRGLAELKPDIVCFQETTIRTFGATYNQAEAIGAAIGLCNAAFAPYGNPIEVMSNDQGGIAFVSRWPIRYTENRRLPEGLATPTDNRVAIVSTLALPKSELHVVTTHLSWRPEEAEMRLVQMGILMDYLEHSGLVDSQVPLLLAGDLNAVEKEPAIQLAQARFKDTYRAKNPDEPGYTWRRDNPLTGHWPLPDRRLDYIFCPQSAKVREAQVVLDKPCPVFPSDHFGLLAEIEFAA